MTRPDVERELERLKDFQRHTVDHAFDRLFRAQDGSGRFLVADEVGLGKTLVARGVIARAIDWLWDTTGRIDIVYVCSNAQIAQANVRKLALDSANQMSLATRLTLLPNELSKEDKDGRTPLESKLNFFAFTPGTSFNHGASSGRADERVLLYALLEQLWPAGTPLKDALQFGVRDRDEWRARVENYERELPERVVQEFGNAIDMEVQLRAEYDRMLADFRGERRSEHVWARRNCVVGRLRMKLARVAIDLLEPDLVILDEFQRFKHLLGGDDPTSELARRLFEYKTPEQRRVRVLLLSATPYKMYSTDAEVGTEDHYQDFIETTRFLMDDPARLEAFKKRLGEYRRGLADAMQGKEHGVGQARDAVQAELCRVMSRTERTGLTADREAMVEEASVTTRVEPQDVRHFVATDALFRAVDGRDPVEFWKSAPYLPNLMHRYRFKDNLRERLHSPPVVDAMRRHGDQLLSRETIGRYARIDPANGRLRALVEDMLGNDQWKMLWVPPSLPYWEPRGAYADNRGFTKALVFSAWNVVPDVVSVLLSYEAERLMLGDSASETDYWTLHKRARPLRFQRKDDRLAGMNTLALQFPCLRLADEVHPLRILREGGEVLSGARAIVSRLVEELPDGEGGADPQWYWAAPVLLESDPELSAFLEDWPTRFRQREGDDGGPADADGLSTEDHASLFAAHVERLKEVQLGQVQLGRKPDDLVDVLTEIALGAPGVVAARTFAMIGTDPRSRRLAAAETAEGFRSLFNEPAPAALVRRLHPDVPYWRAMLRYAIDGNLQSVLDEHVHLTWEQSGWVDHSPSEAVHGVAQDLGSAASLRTAQIKADVFEPGNHGVHHEAITFRTRYALRYGTGTRGRDDERHIVRGEGVRRSFNSPFRPFVLVSTSIGQEGLDFHPWCHAIYHWNLPGNPVDLEQREGRVHRFKGHAIRRNVAIDYGPRMLGASGEAGDDIWALLFNAAERDRPSGTNELVPCWIYEGSHKVQRRVPLLPYSIDYERFARLKRALASYRLVFGQPRQQELLEMMERLGVSPRVVTEWGVDLNPATSV